MSSVAKEFADPILESLLKAWRETRKTGPIYDRMEELDWPWFWVCMDDEYHWRLHFPCLPVDEDTYIGIVHKGSLVNTDKPIVWATYAPFPMYNLKKRWPNIAGTGDCATIEQAKDIVEQALKDWLREHAND